MCIHFWLPLLKALRLRCSPSVANHRPLLLTRPRYLSLSLFVPLSRSSLVPHWTAAASPLSLTPVSPCSPEVQIRGRGRRCHRKIKICPKLAAKRNRRTENKNNNNNNNKKKRNKQKAQNETKHNKHCKMKRNAHKHDARCTTRSRQQQQQQEQQRQQQQERTVRKQQSVIQMLKKERKKRQNKSKSKTKKVEEKILKKGE